MKLTAEYCLPVHGKWLNVLLHVILLVTYHLLMQRVLTTVPLYTHMKNVFMDISNVMYCHFNGNEAQCKMAIFIGKQFATNACSKEQHS